MIHGSTIPRAVQKTTPIFRLCSSAGPYAILESMSDYRSVPSKTAFDSSSFLVGKPGFMKWPCAGQTVFYIQLGVFPSPTNFAG
jgi:hypothetical protein